MKPRLAKRILIFMPEWSNRVIQAYRMTSNVVGVLVGVILVKYVGFESGLINGQVLHAMSVEKIRCSCRTRFASQLLTKFSRTVIPLNMSRKL